MRVVVYMLRVVIPGIRRKDAPDRSVEGRVGKGKRRRGGSKPRHEHKAKLL